MKQMPPIDAATLKIHQEPDDPHMYVNEPMKVSENKQIKEKFRSPTPENKGNEAEHTPIQRRIIRKIRKLSKKEDPTKDAESRKNILEQLQWEGSQIEKQKTTGTNNYRK